MAQINLIFMKNDFVQPRFVGPRFNEATLPLELAKDLLAYQELVKDLACHLYREEHQTRKKVPNNFASNFQLHIDRIDEGSSRPMLALVAAGALAFGNPVDGYLTRARDLVAECIHSVDGSIPHAFPRHLLAHFNKIGQSLRDDEWMELPTPQGQVARLNPERRRSLVSAGFGEYSKEIELKGVLEAIDWRDSTFTIRDLEGKPIIAPLPSDFRQNVGKYGDRPRYLIRFKAIGIYNCLNKLIKVESTENLDVQPDYMLAARFSELAQLKDGWFDGQGRAPDAHKLSWVTSRMVSHYPESIELPAIIPTPEGNLLLEWSTKGDPTVDINLSTMQAHFHAFQGDEGQLEREFDLSLGPNWKGFYGFLEKHIVK